MSKLGWCVPCGEERNDVAATVVIDGDPLCAMHARIAYALEAGCAVKVEEPAAKAAAPARPAGAICSRGCGGAVHRGRCAATFARAKAVEDAEIRARVQQQRPPMLTKLPAAVPLGMDASERAPKAAVARSFQEEVGMDVLVCEEVPVSAVPSVQERVVGRLGALWTRLLVTHPGTALKVKCMDARHAGDTKRHLKAKARKAGVEIGTRTLGDQFYCWRGSQDEAAR